MFTVLVDLRVREEHLAEFLAAISTNAAASLRDEPGCLRFDVHQVHEDVTRFVLHEIYRDADAFYGQHRSAPHYKAWSAAAARLVVPGSQHNTYATPVVVPPHHDSP